MTKPNTQSPGALVRAALVSKRLLGFDTGSWAASAKATRKNAGAKPAFVGVTCFLSGTLIRTLRGDIAVEELKLGEKVVTLSGAIRPIVWLGHRTVNARIHPDPRSVWPIRVAGGAFGPMRPDRDLYLSPGHSICVTCEDEVLVIVDLLVNGSTIARVEMDDVTYWHVELPSHDVLIANGLPTESYLDRGNRDFFVETGADTDRIPAGENRTDPDFCRPCISDGSILEVLRTELAARAAKLGWMSTDAERTLLEARPSVGEVVPWASRQEGTRQEVRPAQLER